MSGGDVSVLSVMKRFLKSAREWRGIRLAVMPTLWGGSFWPKNKEEGGLASVSCSLRLGSSAKVTCLYSREVKDPSELGAGEKLLTCYSLSYRCDTVSGIWSLWRS